MDEFKAFINLTNKDGITAFEYCQNRKRQDIMLHISRFVDKVGHLIKVKAEIIEEVDIMNEI